MGTHQSKFAISKDKIKVDLWQKDIVPSDSLRKWFAWWKEMGEFRRRHFKELDKNSLSVNTILKKAREGSITLLYGSKEEKINNAVALKEYLEKKTKK